ncbi:peptidase C15, pyroglutamyl peptidase I [Lecanosticta acicola]|uniref:Peptidase C15, pyroglutamyl peptidase I, partial n=1 Tax=Lecanosticta acicola TaxID=111012 RepID=A0AAI8Z3H1_9PEZI|nr:peptidase C15, pyroglutamyl peptidase I [Lecanosticta acicola]
MGSIQNDIDIKGDERREITILVTGFGPFQDKFPINPSFEIARSLPDLLPSTSPQTRPVRIIPYGHPIRVAYGEVRELVPKLHDAYAGTVDLVLHIGMASGRKFYCAERFGHRDGYCKNKDLDGKMPALDEGKTTYGDCPQTMTTSLDYETLIHDWDENLDRMLKGDARAHAELQASNDAGHYLCDYIYFNSLAYFGRKSGVMEGGEAKDRPVLFLHVPAESDGDMIDRGRAVALALIRAMADSYSRK